MAKLEAYLALEETVIDLLQRAWAGHAGQLNRVQFETRSTNLPKSPKR
jgi:hypothetical protein